MDQSVTHSTVAQAINADRPDLYWGIHKAMRLCMMHTLAQVGAMDPADDIDVAEALAATREMLELCESHLEHENDFYHPALSARRPGSEERTANDHVSHEEAMAALRDCARTLELSRDAARKAAADRLYRSLAIFVAENFEHMHVEETHNMGVVWSAYSDDEIMAIHQALIESVPPATMAKFLHWMLPSLPHADRVRMLEEMRQTAPADAFDGALQIARSRLSVRNGAKLAAALGLSKF